MEKDRDVWISSGPCGQRPVLVRGIGRKPVYGFFLCMAVVSILLFGCERSRDLPEEPEENVYSIYYLTTNMTKMTGVDYAAEGEDLTSLVWELYDQLLNVPADVDAKSPFSTRTELQRIQWESNVLYLYFDVNYTMMNASHEILCRAALTKTLTQISGVEYINIYTGEQPLMDNQGNPVGMLSAGDFVDSISDVNAFEKSELTLYFADETGEYLVEERREVIHSMNTSMERMIVEQLLEGPETAGYRATIPAETKLLNISVTDNVCYLNFDSGFLSSRLEVKDEISLYSMINSLTQLTTVNRVQFSVNGSPMVMFRDTISLNALFEQNMDYVKGE